MSHTTRIHIEVIDTMKDDPHQTHHTTVTAKEEVLVAMEKKLEFGQFQRG